MNEEIHAVQAEMERHGYIAEPEIATAVLPMTRAVERRWRSTRSRTRQTAAKAIAPESALKLSRK